MKCCKISMSLAPIACAVGKGLLAGFWGTLAITASQTAEMKATGREPSSAPADAAGKVLGVRPVDDAAKARFGQMVHFGYGTGWGAVRALLGLLGLKGHLANLVFAGLVQTTAMILLPALKVAPPVREWPKKQIAVEFFHHLVYAYGTGIAYDRMNCRE